MQKTNRREFLVSTAPLMAAPLLLPILTASAIGSVAAEPVPPAPELQPFWRFCTKCNSLFFHSRAEDVGRCAAGGGHSPAGYVFHLPYNTPGTPTAQSNWRFCGSCTGLFWNGYPDKGRCAAGGPHKMYGFDYVIPHDIAPNGNNQDMWRFCDKCKAMFYDGYPTKGRCPAGGGHNAAGYMFVLAHDLPNVIYRLPFDDDSSWVLSNGNWDDPKHGHNQGNANGLQAYAFDFVHPEGGIIRAARGGTVYVLLRSESKNSYGSSNLCKDGVGNYLVIDHGDGTYGTYWHLGQDRVFVNVGNKVKLGDVIARSGNTGTSTAPHLHFDVRTGWNLSYSKCNLNGTEFPSVRIFFEDKNHISWIPRVGDTLRSNNSP